jgi:hypothetical protein
MAIRRRVNDCLGHNIGASASPVLDDELLAEPFGQPMAIRRAAVSAPAPAAKPTIKCAGRVG